MCKLAVGFLINKCKLFLGRDKLYQSRHRPIDQLDDTQADPRKNKTPHRTKN